MSNIKYYKVPALPAPAWEMPPTQELPRELVLLAMELVTRWCREFEDMEPSRHNWCVAITHMVTDTLNYEEYTRGWSMNAKDRYKCPACKEGTTHYPKTRY